MACITALYNHGGRGVRERQGEEEGKGRVCIEEEMIGEKRGEKERKGGYKSKKKRRERKEEERGKE